MTEENEGKIQPFGSGSHYMAWNEANCCSCRKYKPRADLGTGCPIEEAIALAAILDGQVSQEIWERMSPENNHGMWRCGEWEKEDNASS